MGCRYQNKLDDEAERQWWKHSPWWQKLFYRMFMLLGCVVTFHAAIGWWLFKLF